ncbi:EscU/YscU/HrcU family type III secretion system export apparatus switch protein [Lutibacter sp. B2]|nr:EscU/YscU/HrcU family type III secretion system export apparatus switch protein [Lutibacter sp. B2]
MAKKEIASAIQYDSGKNDVPVVVAKGEGLVAEKIKEIGKESSIPIYKNAELAKKMNNLSIGQEIPPELYQVVAEILSFIIKVDTAKMNEYE